MIAQDRALIERGLRQDGVRDDIVLRDDSLDVDFGYLEAVSIIDGETPWHYDAVALRWAPDHGIEAEHVIVTDAPREALVQAVSDFVREQYARADLIDPPLETGRTMMGDED